MTEPYAPQTAPPPPPPASGSSGMATASLVLGLLGLFCCGLFAGIPAIITGHLALGQVRRGEAADSSRGLAISGLVLGYVSVVLWLLFLLVYAAFAVFAVAQSETGFTPS